MDKEVGYIPHVTVLGILDSSVVPDVVIRCSSFQLEVVINLKDFDCVPKPHSEAIEPKPPDKSRVEVNGYGTQSYYMGCSSAFAWHMIMWWVYWSQLEVGSNSMDLDCVPKPYSESLEPKPPDKINVEVIGCALHALLVMCCCWSVLETVMKWVSGFQLEVGANRFNLDCVPRPHSEPLEPKPPDKINGEFMGYVLQALILLCCSLIGLDIVMDGDFRAQLELTGVPKLHIECPDSKPPDKSIIM